jgi:UV DNA damage endonuclease
MNIGYACIALELNGANQKSCIMKNANNENLYSLINHNLNVLDIILNYNYLNNIKLFRISSDIIPFGSSPANNFKWEIIFKDKLNTLGEKIKKYNIRVSMHPGQYTVLNSPIFDVVERAKKDLDYHFKLLNLLNTNSTNKIILHIGGVYGDKKTAIKRFIQNYDTLPENIKERLTIENDDKFYNIKDLLEISSAKNIPVIYDVLHNNINPFDDKCDNYNINLCKNTWKEKDGRQKIHYSQQENGKRKGTHSNTIDVQSFSCFYNSLKNKDIDVMLEVKDKNISAIKCINIINNS